MLVGREGDPQRFRQSCVAQECAGQIQSKGWFPINASLTQATSEHAGGQSSDFPTFGQVAFFGPVDGVAFSVGATWSWDKVHAARPVRNSAVTLRLGPWC